MKIKLHCGACKYILSKECWSDLDLDMHIAIQLSANFGGFLNKWVVLVLTLPQLPTSFLLIATTPIFYQIWRSLTENR